MSEREHIKRLLKRHRLPLNKRFGQHILVDLDLLSETAGTLCPGPDSAVVEIGAGVGNLTTMLALSGAHVTAIEIDERFRPLHEGEILNRRETAGRIEFVYCDALDFDYAEAARRAQQDGRRFLIAGNIPYQITSPLIMRILESGAAFEAMALMMQREVAERLAAAPGSKRNGAISIKVQSWCEIESLFAVPRTAFLPPPEVESNLLRFRLKDAMIDPALRALLFRLVDAAFSQRRKTMPNAVAAASIAGWTKDAVGQALRAIDHRPATRAEELGLSEFLKLLGALP
ncbi:MAG: 16S rRNA (adenine(1518)-N(6)/adenine(1519)-N(6))-dimethyltransferase RsmA [bacterium]|nr:16S rRNA (adenine(1518)-N(6)/adenine(1519)-N(6))-dimethyltransferase RsmA [Candidatus Sumerlaeota bacterium]